MRKYLTKALVRPILYRVFTYLVLAALAAGLWDRFVNSRGLYSARTHVLPLLAACFFAAAWFAFLSPERAGRKADRRRSGGMLDAVGTEPEPEAALTDGERRAVTVIASLFCGAACLIAALI